MSKMSTEQSVDDNCEAKAPPTSAKCLKKNDGDKIINENLDDSSLLEWWKGVTPWSRLCEDLLLYKETKIIKVKAEHLYKAIKVYIILIYKHGGTMKGHIAELHCIADKVSKGTKAAGNTGGASSGVGVKAAAAGVILSPFTLGASLALTAVGVGTPGAITKEVKATQTKNKIQMTLQDYESLILDIQVCLRFINEGTNQLKLHDLSGLSKTRMDLVNLVRKLIASGGASARAIVVNSKVSGLIHGFTLGVDLFFTEGKGGQELKEGLESKFAKKTHMLAEDLHDGLDELLQINNWFSEHFSGE
ncbi:hypothetical protein PAMP_021425 [Pampus punctatissimus]